MRLLNRDLALSVALFALAMWSNLAHVPTTPFHRDEARWTHRARFVEQLADPRSTYWHGRDLIWGQPPLGSYLTGLGLLAQGRDLRTNELWDFRRGDLWNRTHGRKPSPADLTAARRANAAVGALTVVAVFLIGRGLASWLAGLVAALLLIPHPLSIYLWSLAGSDAPLGLLVALAALAAMGLAARPSWPRALLLGALLGLGGATKLSPMLISLPLAGIGAILLWRRWRGGPPATAALGWRLLAQPCIAATTFIVSYPFLWPDPVGRTRMLFWYRLHEMRNQGIIWSNLDVETRSEALGRVGYWLGDHFSSTGTVAAWLADRVGRSWEPAGLDLPLALVGAEMLVVLAMRRGLGSGQTLAGVVLGSQTAIIVLGMRADFERYYLPVLIAVALCVGLLVGVTVPAVGRWLRRWRTVQATTVVAPVATSPAQLRPASGSGAAGSTPAVTPAAPPHRVPTP